MNSSMLAIKKRKTEKFQKSKTQSGTLSGGVVSTSPPKLENVGCWGLWILNLSSEVDQKAKMMFSFFPNFNSKLLVGVLTRHYICSPF